MSNPKAPSPRQCPAHRMWLRKGQCELCRLEQDKQRHELEKLIGSNKQEVKITKI